MIVPVVVVVDAVPPATNKLLATYAPPATCTAPVLEDVELVVLAAMREPPVSM